MLPARFLDGSSPHCIDRSSRQWLAVGGVIILFGATFAQDSFTHAIFGPAPSVAFHGVVVQHVFRALWVVAGFGAVGAAIWLPRPMRMRVSLGLGLLMAALAGQSVFRQWPTAFAVAVVVTAASAVAVSVGSRQVSMQSGLRAPRWLAAFGGAVLALAVPWWVFVEATDLFYNGPLWSFFGIPLGLTLLAVELGAVLAVVNVRDSGANVDIAAWTVAVTRITFVITPFAADLAYAFQGNAMMKQTIICYAMTILLAQYLTDRLASGRSAPISEAAIADPDHLAYLAEQGAPRPRPSPTWQAIADEAAAVDVDDEDDDDSADIELELPPDLQ